mmetsp:Transcript_17569/g.56912  ORF Transcript_17569/g.56912 Transcript_17569/m.56912 type:complete len:235 (-) Transcript_17569:708-1412(-)
MCNSAPSQPCTQTWMLMRRDCPLCPAKRVPGSTMDHANFRVTMSPATPHPSVERASHVKGVQSHSSVSAPSCQNSILCQLLSLEVAGNASFCKFACQSSAGRSLAIKSKCLSKKSMYGFTAGWACPWSPHRQELAPDKVKPATKANVRFRASTQWQCCECSANLPAANGGTSSTPMSPAPYRSHRRRRSGRWRSSGALGHNSCNSVQSAPSLMQLSVHTPWCDVCRAANMQTAQ